MNTQEKIDAILSCVYTIMGDIPCIAIIRHPYSGEGLEAYDFKEGEIFYTVTFQIVHRQELTNGRGRTLEDALEDALKDVIQSTRLHVRQKKALLMTDVKANRELSEWVENLADKIGFEEAPPT